jgi:uncharacterized protein YcbK (DUF882 family)
MYRNQSASGSVVYSARENVRLSPNFTAREFQSRCGSDRIVIHPALVELLQALRAHFRRPVSINSGYRSPEHNRKIGGAAKSLHMDGRAADIVVSGIAPAEVARVARELGAGGVKAYSTWVHVDVGPVRTW